MDARLDFDAPRRRLLLDGGARLELGAGDGEPVVVCGDAWRLSLGVLPSELREALGALAAGIDEEDAANSVHRQGGAQALAHWSLLVQRLLDTGALRCTLSTAANEQLATFALLVPGRAVSLAPLHHETTATLSRFALMRAVNGVAALESPLGRARVQIHDLRLAAVVAGLAAPTTAGALAASTGLGVAVLTAFLGFLRGAGALATAEEAPPDPHARGLPLWEFADALFHVNSRLGRRERAYGATYRFRNRVQPPPAAIEAVGDVTPLVAPDLATCVAKDPPFTTVLEGRRSRRALSDEPIDVTVLSEFLFRSCRNTDAAAVVAGVPSGGGQMERMTRPYPSAGGCHPLEVYIVAHRCAGLARDMYRYDAASHGLVACAAEPRWLDRLVAEARCAALLANDPPVLVVVAARFARTMWKYEGMAYAALLKDAGGLLQTMYLVATVMGLAPCAIGGGDAECFAAAAGTAFWEESSVAEFVLGYGVA